ncbi:DNA topoisomerase 2 [Zea mays]|uniref:DNA topoisomerase (ATP-hydrolyzing) n=2 Tax=Zea mays TaxID=4577 RepID=A0A3L6F216_MAIZE|nr:DNA topoisomerase 2 [Zea mays]
MHLFDSDGKIRKYDTPEQILEEFFQLRLEFYCKRKEALLKNIKLDLKKLENKVRFIRCVVDNEIIVNNRKRADLFLELRHKNFDPFPKKKKKAEPTAVGAIEEEENVESPETAVGVDPSDYEYLLSMSIGTLTLEKIQELNAEKQKLVDDVVELMNTSPKSLWLKDLDAFEKELDVLDQMDLAEEVQREKRIKEGKKGGSKAAPKKQPKKAAPIKLESSTEDNAAEPVVAKRGAQQKKAPKKVRI